MAGGGCLEKPEMDESKRVRWLLEQGRWVLAQGRESKLGGRLVRLSQHAEDGVDWRCWIEVPFQAKRWRSSRIGCVEDQWRDHVKGFRRRPIFLRGTALSVPMIVPSGALVLNSNLDLHTCMFPVCP